jgi:hypothetical protein
VLGDSLDVGQESLSTPHSGSQELPRGKGGSSVRGNFSQDRPVVSCKEKFDFSPGGPWTLRRAPLQPIGHGFSMTHMSNGSQPRSRCSLRRLSLLRADGSEIATNPVPSFLRAGEYPNAEKVLLTDYLRQSMSREAFVRMPVIPLPVIYVRQQGDWLQYWLVYFYDDPGLLGLGVHQADLEMIQLKVDGKGNVTSFAFSQHRSGVRGTTNQIEWAT